MSGVVLLDTNLALLLVVGSTDRGLIGSHKRLGQFTVDHFDLLVEALRRHEEFLFIPHVLAETSNLLSHTANPARSRVRETFRRLVEITRELPVSSAESVAHPTFAFLGLTDAALLHGLALIPFSTLATADQALADQARGLSCPVLDLSNL